MSKPFYVKVETPKELQDAAYEALRISNQTGKIKKGTNEATKAIERSQAKLVIIAENVEPPEVVAHLPILCEERKIPYVFVSDKEKIGSAIGIDVPAASACITEAGDAAGLLKEILTRLEAAKKGA